MPSSNALKERFPSIRRKSGVVTDPLRWASTPGYEFWVVFGHVDIITAMGNANSGIDGHGWQTQAAQTHAEGSAGDFLSSTDIDTSYLIPGTGAFGSITSPVIFGSYVHALQAARFLGQLPTKLSLEAFARFSTASANETTTYFGLAPKTSTDSAVSMGAIRSGGTASTFFLQDSGGNDAGANIDTAWHKWKITYGLSTMEWFIDDVSQGTRTMITDGWPAAFVAHNATNVLHIAWARVYYEL